MIARPPSAVATERTGQPWSPMETATLLRWRATGVSFPKIAAHLRRSVGACKGKIRDMRYEEKRP